MSNPGDDLRLSAVMAVYDGDQPDAVRAAIDSVLAQSRPADEFIIVIDGPIDEGLTAQIADYNGNPIISVHSLAVNQGRGPARNFAINKATGDVVVMMDADDVSRPDRFALQITRLVTDNLDVVGGFIEEFDNQPGDKQSVRMVPLDMTGITAMVKFRSAFNHVTLMYRRDFFLAVGGYSALNFVEDWDFYQRAVHAGGRLANIDQVLVDVQAVPARRRNYAYFHEELFVLGAARRRGQLGLMTYLLSFAVRVVKLIIPLFIFALLYHFVLRRR
jgi:glycosyltransferase involved in cell wall biosynthesis